MHEDGAVEGAKDARSALRKIRSRARKLNPGMTITAIEWRHGLNPEPRA